MGASIFSAIESPIEKDEMDRLRQKKQDFLQKYDCITGKTYNDRNSGFGSSDGISSLFAKIYNFLRIAKNLAKKDEKPLIF